MGLLNFSQLSVIAVMIVTGTVHVHVLKYILLFFFTSDHTFLTLFTCTFLHIMLSKSASNGTHQLTNKNKILENIQLTRELLKGRDGVSGRDGLPRPPGAPG